MLTFKKNTEVIADNKVTLCDLEYFLTDDETLKLKSIVEAMISQRNHNQILSKVSTPERVKNDTTVLHVPEDNKKSSDPIPGKYMYQGSFCTVTDCTGEDNVPDYRIYIHCPIAGENGKKIRNGIKYSATEKFNAKWAGDYDNSIFFWAFPTKKDANAFIKSEKEYAKKRDQAKA